MANYLVTGAAGFIASRVAEMLLDEGHNVTGVDNLNDAYDVRLKQWRLGRLGARPGFQFQRVDICDRSAMHLLLGEAGSRGFDAVLNLAARAGVRPSVENPWVYVETNVIGTLNLLDLCREFGVGKFVLASTSGLYGASDQTPYREDQNTDHPLSPYAASKKGAEALCHTYHHLYGIDISILRYFTVYGPAGRPDMSPFRFVQWISDGRPVTVYGDGRQSRDFTYIDDIARGTVDGLKPLGCETINLGCDSPIVLNDVIALIEELAGKRAQLDHQPPHPADVPVTWADIGKARRLLGWEPQVQFREGMRRVVEWYNRNREWARDIKT